MKNESIDRKPAIRNVIFDMGGVMIRYDPAHFVRRTGIESAEDRDALMKAVFRAPEWPLMDRGVLDEAAFEALAFQRLPERLHDVAHRLIFAWEEPMEPIPGMADLARACKARGRKVFLLSNASARQPEYWPRIPGSECFDGAVISALEHCLKPEEKIYRILLERYGLKAEESLFIDDVPANVAGAERVGLRGALFTGDLEMLRRTVLETL